MSTPAPETAGTAALSSDGGAVVWTLDLDEPVDTSCLSPDETLRAARFHHERDGARYAAGRSALRSILARHLACAPSTLVFAYGPHGKPSLRGADLHFNLSHSGADALIAVARRPLGIDIERIDARHATPAMVWAILADEERAAWHALPMASRAAGFFKAWTSREALAKATGLGLSTPRQSVAVCVDPSQPARVLRGAEGWRLESLEAPHNYAATLAVAATAQAATRTAWRPGRFSAAAS